MQIIIGEEGEINEVDAKVALRLIFGAFGSEFIVKEVVQRSHEVNEQFALRPSERAKVWGWLHDLIPGRIDAQH